MNLKLYSPNRIGKPRTLTGFATPEKAKQTLQNIAKYNITYQKQVVITMYNRAKYHPHRTASMVDAMKIYANWMKKNDIKLTLKAKQSKKSKKNIKIKHSNTVKNYHKL
uniref:Uncharacterized protein n=1 Tax=viral metagenome TaxID=1070528 RepID=A0A6C0HLM9_9ZZZZ